LLVRFRAYGWPVYVTENGIADARDERRADYLRAHIYAIERAIAGGADVRGYFHWSLVDNFEWDEGFGGQFGLFSVDRGAPGMPRTMRPSGESYREIARNLGLTPADM
jgi:beta-glucosidase